MIDTYTVYAEHCRKKGWHVPSREDFYRHTSILSWYRPSGAKQRLDDLEIEKEVREGWGYGDRR